MGHMISSRWMRLISLSAPIVLLSSPAWADCGKCHHESACGHHESKCHHEFKCGDPCKKVSHCEKPCKEEKPKCAKADLERLSACMPCGSNQLTVTYKVETEH